MTSSAGLLLVFGEKLVYPDSGPWFPCVGENVLVTYDDLLKVPSRRHFL